MAPITRVGIIGGTHGNEVTGVAVVRHLQAQEAAHPGWLEGRTGVETRVVIGNPAAVAIGRRYVDRDLNRSFDPSLPLDELGAGRSTPGTAADGSSPLEASRALEVQRVLFAGMELRDEVALFDCHTTTAAMGAALIPTNLSRFNRALLRRAAERHPEVRVYLWVQAEGQPRFLNGLSPHGYAIEVGPVPQGVLRADAIDLTRRVLDTSLEAVAAYNAGRLDDDGGTVTIYEHVDHLDYPRDADGFPAAVIHPDLQDADFRPLTAGAPLFLGLDGRVVPYEGEAGLVPVFINEAAYYEKGVALALTRPREIEAPRLL